MKGDFTRMHFRRDRHYSGVLQQQGRVQLDADWNEQLAIEHHVVRTTTRDVVGPAGAPETEGGFALAAASCLYSFDVAAGAAWVTGEAGTALEATVSAGGGGPATTSGWTIEDSTASADLRSVAAIDAGTAFAVGGGGTIVKLQAGGAGTVQPLPGGATSDLEAVAFADATHGIAVGAGAAIYATGDGTSWVAQTAPAGVTEPLRAVSFASDLLHAWAVGDATQIVATDDGGQNWSIQTAPSADGADLLDVCFAQDLLHGWAVGGGASIVATDDGGSTWTSQTPPDGVTATLYSVHTLDGNELWAVGETATILYSGDAGATWSVVPPPTGIDADLFGVRAVGTAQALTVGDVDVVLSLEPPSGGVPVPQDLPTTAVDLSVSPGRIYIDGILVESERAVRVAAQPDLPGQALPTAPGTYLAFLDVWERHLTAVERPDLREVALGGPDTATRTQVLWQVRLSDVTPGDGDAPTCSSFGSDWTPDTSPRGRMRARAKPSPLTASDCMVPANGGYQRLENQLYRVEVHTPGEPGTATLKWSRDNGSMVSLLDAIDDAKQTITVAQPGRDDVIGFASAAIVELSDDGRVLRGEPGDLVPVQKFGPEQNTIHWNPVDVPVPPEMSDFGAGATVRRWDGEQGIAADTWIDIEGGVQVEFTGGEYKTGDYWLIPARTLTAEIEWPSEDGVELYRDPDGIRHHYCPLGLVTLDGGGEWSVDSDCRKLFPPLTEMTRFFYVGGDGQEGDPSSGQPLPEPLEVGVMNGSMPVVGASVRFEVVAGGGQLAPAGSTGGDDNLVAVTDGSGIAAASWTLGADGDAQRVEVHLLDAGGDPTQDTPLHFNAEVEAPAQGGVCTVTVSPDDDLRAAARSLVERGGGEMCLAAGTYDLREPIVFEGDGTQSVTITGRGAATRIEAAGLVAFGFTMLADVVIRNVSVTSAGEREGAAGGEPGLLEFAACGEVKVLDCVLRSVTSAKVRGACISADLSRPPAAGVRSAFVLERNRLEVGTGQIGVVTVGGATVRAVGNRVLVARPRGRLLGGIALASAVALARAQTITAAGRETPTTDVDVIKGKLQHTIVNEMKAAQQDQSADTEQIQAGRRTLNVLSSAPAASLWREFASAPEATRRGALDQAISSFSARVTDGVFTVAGEEGDALSEPLVGALSELVDALQSVSGAIFAFGAEDIEIVDNVVEDALWGIVVGFPLLSEEKLSRARTAPTQRVLVSRNFVRCLVPVSSEGGAVLVTGPCASVTVADTIATLERPSGGPIESASRYPPAAVDVHADLGPFMVVRQLSSDGFTFGARVRPGGDGRDAEHMWLVGEVMAANTFGGEAVDVDPALVVVEHAVKS